MVIGRDMDGPRVCHTEGSQSATEKQTSDFNRCMWNLKK